MSFGRAFARALGGAVLGWLAMILAVAAVEPRLLMLLVFWPVYGIHLVLSGLVAALLTAWLARRLSRGAILAISAVLAVALFAALPLWFLSLNANSTRW
ncbi:MAG: hypothetical protein JWR00_400 [Rubritepida sp.]|nr:hypothetical protein [Rubritepida sp.]